MLAAAEFETGLALELGLVVAAAVAGGFGPAAVW